MKILHVIQSLSPADGGPPQAVRNLMHAYRTLDVQAEVLCLDAPGTDFLSDVVAPVHAIGPVSSKFGYTAATQQWLRGHLAEFDGMVLHYVWGHTGIVARRAAQAIGKEYVVFPHGGLDPWFNKRYPLKKLKKQLFWPWQYPVLRDAKAVLFTSDTERDLAATSFQPSRWNGVAVPYGAMEPEGDSATQAAAWFQHAPQLQQGGRPRRYLLFLARIHEKKGCDLLVGAFARIAHTVPDLHLVIAGPDQVGLQAKLQQQAKEAGIADRVHWPGMLRGDVKWGALRNCEAFVLPSHQENFGIAVAEALACERPVLISDQVNIWPDIVADEVGLVGKDTLEGTQELLEKWLSLSESEREAYASRALGCFRKRYSMTETARTLQEFFEVK